MIAVKAAMPSSTMRTERWNSSALPGEDARRDRLEELQRRPGEHQHVEDEARRRRALEAARDQRPRVEEGLFAEHDHQHGRGEPGTVRDRDRRVARALRRGRGSRPAGEGERDHHQAQRGSGDDADCHRRLAAEQADRDQQREQGSEDRLGEDQRGEEAEAFLAGEEAAGEVAGGVEEDSREEDPVEGFVPLEQVVLQGAAQSQGEDGEERRQAELDRRRGAHRAADRLAPHPVFGDVAGKQLFDRSVEGRDGDEDGRPDDRYLAVVGLGENVRGDEEVDVGDDAGEADADREEARGLAVVGRRRAAARRFAGAPHQRTGAPCS
jgi:ribonuclease E